MIKDRKIFGKSSYFYNLTDLTALQTFSYGWLIKEGIKELLEEVSPIEDLTGKNFELHFLDCRIGEPKYTTEQAIEKGTSYSAPLKARTRLINKETGETLEQEVYLGDLPLMTSSGTFIINGVERVIVSQLTRGFLYFRDRSSYR